MHYNIITSQNVDDGSYKYLSSSLCNVIPTSIASRAAVVVYDMLPHCCNDTECTTVSRCSLLYVSATRAHWFSTLTDVQLSVFAMLTLESLLRNIVGLHTRIYIAKMWV